MAAARLRVQQEGLCRGSAAAQRLLQHQAAAGGVSSQVEAGLRGGLEAEQLRQAALALALTLAAQVRVAARR